MSKYVLSAVCTMFLVGSSLALAVEPQPALHGYCPVCLVNDKLVKGDPKFSSVYDGKTYLNPSAKVRAMFTANPTRFIPALGGDCTVSKVELGQNVPGKTEFRVMHDGRMFLFASAEQKRKFQLDPHRYVDADLALGGACSVCLVQSGKIVSGKPEYASVYDGQRYLFPSLEQKRVFDEQPTSFTPAMRGKCTVCKVEKNVDMAGKVEYHLTHNNRLYLFPSQKQLDTFKANPERYADADVALDGYCSVCKVETGKDIRGKSQFAADFRGKRYLFLDQGQLDRFRRNPTMYAEN